MEEQNGWEKFMCRFFPAHSIALILNFLPLIKPFFTVCDALISWLIYTYSNGIMEKQFAPALHILFAPAHFSFQLFLLSSLIIHGQKNHSFSMWVFSLLLSCLCVLYAYSTFICSFSSMKIKFACNKWQTKSVEQKKRTFFTIRTGSNR